MAKHQWMIGVVLCLLLHLVLVQADQQAETICHEGDCYPAVFEPTDEFRPVMPGQHIPAGCHVRLSMEDGKQYAKWSDDRNDVTTSRSSEVTIVPEKEEEDSTIPPLTPERMKELQEALEVIMNFTAQESQQLINAVNILHHVEASIEEHLQALETLKELVHSGEHARDLITLRAPAKLIQLTTHEDEAIAKQALHVIATSLQNNAEVQAHFHDNHNLVDHLLELLRRSKAITLPTVQALGRLLRGHEGATQRFIDAKGIERFSALHREHPDHYLLRRQLFTIVADMKGEVERATGLEAAVYESYIAQVRDTRWCDHADEILNVDTRMETMEALLQSLRSLQPLCPEPRALSRLRVLLMEARNDAADRAQYADYLMEEYEL